MIRAPGQQAHKTVHQHLVNAFFHGTLDVDASFAGTDQIAGLIQ